MRDGTHPHLISSGNAFRHFSKVSEVIEGVKEETPVDNTYSINYDVRMEGI